MLTALRHWPAAAATAILLAATASAQNAPIDRHALVTRHNVLLTQADPALPLQVGNGEFAFATDATGLQSLYGNTMSQWGWHTFPLPAGERPEHFRLTPHDTYGRMVGYPTSSKAQPELYKWLRENPHRLNLGRLSLRLDGKPLAAGQLTNIRHALDLWRGTVVSQYDAAGAPVAVSVCCHPRRDLIAVRVESPLVAAGRLDVEFAFPYGSPGASGADWNSPTAHKTVMTRGDRCVVWSRELDADRYTVSLSWQGQADVKETAPHTFLLSPAKESPALEFVCAFSPTPAAAEFPTPAEVRRACQEHWAEFWGSGGAIDLSGSKDPRWRELERRIVLSQYLTAIQSAGTLPPQESCLVNNGWNGKFHLEMHWWHAVHFALWDRWPMLDRSLDWYRRILPAAKALAQRQGYRGARWPKMVGPEGRDSPSGVGPLLIWQQPHPIYYAELNYRAAPTRDTLDKWKDVVFATADFLASYAVRDDATGRYVLGPPMKTVPENTDPAKVRNPPFELSYWRFGLRVAQQWRTRLGLPRDPRWDEVLANLAPLPQQEGLYLSQEGMADTYTKWNWEHPSLVGMRGMLPGDGADAAVMKATVRKVWGTWQWDRKTWGWDFPLVAMAAARNGEPQIAVEALLHPAARNQFAANGFSSGGPYPYFPSNGGLLTAVAMMAAGWDGAPPGNAPGFPADWTVKWENLKPLP